MKAYDGRNPVENVRCDFSATVAPMPTARPTPVGTAANAILESVNNQASSDLSVAIHEKTTALANQAATAVIAALRNEVHTRATEIVKSASPTDTGEWTVDSAVIRLVAIGIAANCGISVHWLVQQARDRGTRWADIGAVLGITPQAAAKRFANTRQPAEDVIASSLESALNAVISKGI